MRALALVAAFSVGIAAAEVGDKARSAYLWVAERMSLKTCRILDCHCGRPKPPQHW